MKRSVAVAFVVALLFAMCTSSFAEDVVLGKDSVRVGVVLTCENFEIPDDLENSITGIFSGVLSSSNLLQVVNYNQIEAARSRLGFIKSEIGNTQKLAAIGKEADVHFIIWARIIYDFDKAMKKEAAKGIGKMFGLDLSPFAKKEKPVVNVSVIEADSAKIVFDNKLKTDIFSSAMKEELAIGLLTGQSLSSSLINVGPFGDIAKKFAPVMKQLMEEAALLKLQKESGNYSGMVDTVSDLMNGKTHDTDDIKNAAMQIMGNDVDPNKLNNVVNKIDTLVKSGEIKDKEQIKAAVMKIINEEQKSSPASVAQPQKNSTTVTPVPIKSTNNSSTTSSYVSPVKKNESGKIIVGVMQFQSGNGNIEHSQAALIGDIFTQMLATSDKIAIVEREFLASIATENKLASSGYISNETACEIGRLAGCNIIITGSVTDYTKLSKSSGVLIVSSSKEEAKAAANMNVINVETGKLMLSTSESGRAAQSGNSLFLLAVTKRKTQVTGMEAAAVAELSSRLCLKAREVITGEYPQVTSVSTREIRFNIGSSLGANKNEFYRVYTTDKGYEENIAIVKITDVKEDYSSAKIANKKAGKFSLIREGDHVFPVDAKELQQILKKKSFIKSR